MLDQPDEAAETNRVRIAFKMTQQEAIFLRCLLHSPIARKDLLMEVIGPREKAPGRKILDVVIWKIRKKIAFLKPSGVEIITIWGVGWSLRPEAKEIVRRYIAENSIHA